MQFTTSVETQCCETVCADRMRVQTHIQWSLRSQGGARRVLCHASSEDCCCAPKQTRVHHPVSTRDQNTTHRRANLASHNHPSRSTGSPRDDGAVFLHKKIRRDLLNQSQTPISNLWTTKPQRGTKNVPVSQDMKVCTVTTTITHVPSILHTHRATQGTNAKPRQNEHFAGCSGSHSLTRP